MLTAGSAFRFAFAAANKRPSEWCKPLLRRRRNGNCQRRRQISRAVLIDELFVVVSEIVEIALKQDIAAKHFFDGRLLWMRAGYGDATLPVANKIHGLSELDSGHG